MDGFVHVDLTNDQGLVLDVNGCIDCHSYSPGYVLEFYQLGTIVHNLHYQSESFSGDCFSCHNMTADGNGMTLWDNVKYDSAVFTTPTRKPSTRPSPTIRTF